MTDEEYERIIKESYEKEPAEGICAGCGSYAEGCQDLFLCETCRFKLYKDPPENDI
jgi:hypothetical protein